MEFYKNHKSARQYIKYQPSKFRTKNWVEMNDDVRGRYNTNSQIKFKTTMLKSSYMLIMMRTYLLKEP